MKLRFIPIVAAGVAVLAAGCGREDNDSPEAAAAPPATAPAAAPTTTIPATTVAPTTVAAAPAASAAPAVKAGESELGQLLVDADGLTLYGFTNDIDAISTCYSTCADAWPPVIVDEEWSVGPGLDTGIFSTTERDDGTLQLVAGKFPLYLFGGDAAPGDITGHGSGDVWFGVGLDGTLLAADAAPAAQAAAPETTAPAAPFVSVGPSDLGDVLVDENGLTLYGFTKDANGEPTCEGDCADAWPPVFVDGLPEGLDPAVFSVVQRPDGSHQLKAGKWPLYRFAGDAAPGETNGQGSGDVWFVADPAGGLIKNAG